MKPTVHILLTVRKPELLPMQLLVFATLREGFPDNPVCVWGNALAAEYLPVVCRAVAHVDGKFQNLPATAHDAWIEQLIDGQRDPFWICDADVVFFEPVRVRPDAATLLAGRHEPAWHDPFMAVDRAERVHTCVLWINPGALRAALLRFGRTELPAVFHGMQVPWVRQTFLPRRHGCPLFYDTLAGVWQAFSSRCHVFTAIEDDAFEHAHCGSYGDAVSTTPEYKDIPRAHAGILANPALAKGIRLQQEKFYADHPPQKP